MKRNEEKYKNKKIKSLNIEVINYTIKNEVESIKYENKVRSIHAKTVT